MEKAARKELQRMLDAGMLEPIQTYTPHVSRGFFVEKGSSKTVTSMASMKMVVKEGISQYSPAEMATNS